MYAPQLDAYRSAKNSTVPEKGIEPVVMMQPAPLPSAYGKSWEAPSRAMYAPQLEAYRTAKNSTASGREIEAGALTRCALMLSDSLKNWDAPDREQQLAEALRANQQVWSIFQSELVKDDNPLPVKIRENILTLSVFIDNRIIQVMAHPSPEKLKILIDINLNLAAGLRGSPAE